MQTDKDAIRRLFSQDLMDLLIRVGIVVILVIASARVFAPFAGIMAWALILAVAIYPLHRRLAAWLGNRQGRAASLFVIGGLLLVGAPTVILGTSLANQIHEVATAVEAEEFTIKQPPAKVAEWPLIGNKVHTVWEAAATNLPALIKKNSAQIKKITKSLLSGTATVLGGALMFLGAFIIAGIMMAYGESGSTAMMRISQRLAGPEKGVQMHSLSVATIRSVAMGVVGVAFIQALLLGAGFILAGIPAAGVLAFIVLFLGIVQLPALLVSLPVVGYMWWSGDGSNVHNLIFSVYLIVAGFADNVLKPLLLGRGVDVPMPVVLIGALGGMVTAGFIGLFVGAVLLSVGYKLFMQWVDQGPGEPAAAVAGDDGALPAAGTDC
jgi:predicted PurR-regulated permease PerM